MNSLHQEILELLKQHATVDVPQEINLRYHGNTHYYYGLRVPLKRQLVSSFVKSHPELTPQSFAELITSLVEGPSYEEKTFGGHLVETATKLRRQLDPNLLDHWLDNLVGWAEIDTFCQSSFTAEELLTNWDTWQELLRNFAKDPNISKRRASLVLLIKSVGTSPDSKLSQLAFENIRALQHEKDILITKAISWLLRTLIKYHQEEVTEYLEKNRDKLPKIAVRETAIKLKYGIKNYKGV